MDNKNFSLALSGGGFRASLFHIGSLMRLSEAGLLQNATSISTVSGGSIIGVLYYLHLKYLLETKENVSKIDVIDVVNDVKKEFFDAMKKNIICQPFKPKYILKLGKTFSKNYSRTNLLSEIYFNEIYKNIWDKIVKHWKNERYRPKEWEDIEKDDKPYLFRLKIYPKSIFKNKKDFSSFDYKEYNLLDFEVKIPDLIINATNLNTGLLWRFSATKYGEYLSLKDIFTNEKIKKKFVSECKEKKINRLRADFGIEKLFSLYLDDRKCKKFFDENSLESEFENFEKFRKSLINFFQNLINFSESHMYHFFKNEDFHKITFCDAVAASAAVPGIFTPFIFKDSKKYKNLYKIDNILLADGGVYDNQGLESLKRKIEKYKIKEKKDENLGMVFCSDASKQCEISKIDTKIIDVLFKSSDIMGDRLRSLTIDMLYNEKNRSDLKFILIHLKQFIKKDFIFEIDEEFARLNSNIRTQLNRFWDEEIKSLVLHSYILTDYFLNRYFSENIENLSKKFKDEVLKYQIDIKNRKNYYKSVLKLSKSKFSTIPIFLYKHYYKFIEKYNLPLPKTF